MNFIWNLQGSRRYQQLKLHIHILWYLYTERSRCHFKDLICNHYTFFLQKPCQTHITVVSKLDLSSLLLIILDCYSDPQRWPAVWHFCTVMMTTDWSWRGNVLYFADTTLQKGEREKNRENLSLWEVSWVRRSTEFQQMYAQLQSVLMPHHKIFFMYVGP